MMTRRYRYTLYDQLFSEPSETGLYWLGFCAADGYVYKAREVQVQLALRDRNHLELFKIALRTEKPIYDYSDRKFPKSSFYVTSRELAYKLSSFSYKTILDAPHDLRHHLIRGIFDGDGSVSCADRNYGNLIAYTRQVRICAEQAVCEAIAETVFDEANTTYGHIRKARGISEWSLQGAANLRRFHSWLYKDATILLQRKFDAFVLDRDVTPRRRGIRA